MSSAANSTDSMTDQACGGGSGRVVGRLGLRVVAIFIILVTSLFGTLFPILARKSASLRLPRAAFDLAKFFGSGVIIATAFIHLLAPANEALSSPCLPHAWSLYPWAQGIALASVFVLFLIEVFAYRIGSKHLARLGVEYHSHGFVKESEAAPPHLSAQSGLVPPQLNDHTVGSLEACSGKTHVDTDEGRSPAAPQDVEAMSAKLIGVAILEFGIIFHSVVIGITLAVDPQFTTFFIVIIFHQMFEGLGLGSRLSEMEVPHGYEWLRLAGAVAYSFMTPLGLAVGLGVRNAYDPDSAAALITSGSLDSFSAGVLLYTGLVELLAHDFMFNKSLLIDSSDKKLATSIGSVLLGAGLMALLGRWA